MNIRPDHDLPLSWQHARALTRRQFLKRSQSGLGGLAMAMLLEREGRSIARGAEHSPAPSADTVRLLPHAAPAAAAVLVRGAASRALPPARSGLGTPGAEILAAIRASAPVVAPAADACAADAGDSPDG